MKSTTFITRGPTVLEWKERVEKDGTGHWRSDPLAEGAGGLVRGSLPGRRRAVLRLDVGAA